MTTPYQLARRIAITGLAVSAALAILKITIGLAAGSAATVADGVESAADVFASGLLILGLTLAARPADRNHPYGHGRFEILTGLAIGSLLCITGAAISYRSYLHIGHTGGPPQAYAIWPLLISLAAKAALSYYKLRIARRVQSGALAADGKNDFVDVISGTTALAALALTIHDPNRFANASTLSAFLPTSIGSGMTMSPLASLTPPSARIARMERTRCWFVPIRPVTPCMMMPRRRVAIPIPPARQRETSVVPLSNRLVTRQPAIPDNGKIGARGASLGR